MWSSTKRFHRKNNPKLLLFTSLKTLFLLFPLFSFFFLSGCKVKSTSDQIVIVNGPEPESLDPHVITGQLEGRIVKALFEGLTTWNAKGEIIPGTAERWECSPDGKCYRFYLRKTFWTNGKPVEAKDFVLSWKRALDPNQGSRYADLFFWITNAKSYYEGKINDFSLVGIKAIGQSILEVQLEDPIPFFLQLVAEPVFFPLPIDTINVYGEDWIKVGKIVSNGPYILDEWKINDRIVLKKNPYYWAQSSIKTKELDLLTTTKASTAFNLFYCGIADLILDKGLVPTFFIEKIRQKPYFHSSPIFATYFYRFNTQHKPLNDSRIRCALAMAIDKSRLVRIITRGGELPAGSITPPGIPGYNSPSGLPYNPTMAKKLLAEAGYPNGKGFPPLSILYNSGELNEQIATEIQAMWQENLGIHVGLRNQEWKVYLNSLSQLDFDIARSSWVGDYADPTTFLNLFTQFSSNNETGWFNNRYEELLTKAQKEVNRSYRFQILQSAEKILVEEELPIIPLYFYSGILLYDPEKIGGIEPNLLDEHPFSKLFRKN
ncbi:peptide ABC transporter substrate-binding protein [Candidatus Methylacidiphilum fumarolicum]|uniref:ABC-type oligopeptide transport system,periplasmic component n=2 Tax=Candidatus Methylacidiphilum fumarolicum TaxID=591154 RepID=I0JWK3_METFB|nr:peptide ABC transporter substrate-binding protein [Candidatus Methylacidiphilum fumarolicum]CCG91622.1 ABC-type oligopeptide transport system,periplasmic component [Methylacidiphilum fumariolicum SolV]TFE68657.1 peptide ABC transporter substrate-binding protein [Candidatus Methylacidiphilum fumarolicum]TFE72582.1 peptide ABC transporter substrate-binding protein [Candidatus Methylacidiphilum fumarolicum]TFE73899.1 peptide ABC transporter substrate-binding protein [Candidatus Methylacidiphilu